MNEMPRFENKKPDLLEVSRELGFSPSVELKELESKIDYEKSFEENREAIVNFITASQDSISNIEDQYEYARNQIGLYVHMAEVYKKLNNTEMQEDSINDAIEYAYQYDLNDIVGKLKSL